MANSNCLEGLRCPDCGNDSRFYIAGTALFEVFDDGTGDVEQIDWEDDSNCLCPNCQKSGKVSEFRTN